MGVPYQIVAGKSVERLAALSDGVFAFAMTLLALDLRTPLGEIRSEWDLVHALAALAPRLITFLMSFITLGIFWVGQQTQLNTFVRSNRDLTWIHLGFLAVVVLVPFTTALLTEYITYRTALVLYWFNILLLGVTLYAAWWYANRAQLTRTDMPEDLKRSFPRRVIAAQTLYAIGVLLCLINTYVSIAFIVLVQLNYAIAPRLRPLDRL